MQLNWLWRTTDSSWWVVFHIFILLKGDIAKRIILMKFSKVCEQRVSATGNWISDSWIGICARLYLMFGSFATFPYVQKHFIVFIIVSMIVVNFYLIWSFFTCMHHFCIRWWWGQYRNDREHAANSRVLRPLHYSWEGLKN